MTYGHANIDEATLLPGQVAAPDVRAQDVDAGWRSPSSCVKTRVLPRLSEAGLDPGTLLNPAGDNPQERRFTCRHSDDAHVNLELHETLTRPQRDIICD